MRVTAKGQVTIPRELRDQFALGPGSEVEIVGTEGGALIRPVTHSGTGSRLVAHLRDRADGELTADEVLRLTRGENA